MPELSSPDVGSPLTHQLSVLGLISAVKKLGPAEYRMPPQQWASLILNAERAADFLGEIAERRKARQAGERGASS